MKQLATILQDIGLTNYGSEDYGSIASASEKSHKDQAYCTSEKCCTYVESTEEVFNTKKQEMEIISKYKRSPKVTKEDQTGYNCTGCRQPLIWKKVKV